MARAVVIKCPTCGKTFPSQGALLAHRQTHITTKYKAVISREQSSTPSPPIYPPHLTNKTCPYCKKEFQNTISLDNHIRSEHF